MSALLDAITAEISQREDRKVTLAGELETVDAQLEQLRAMAEQAKSLNGDGPVLLPPPGETPSPDVATNGGRGPSRRGRKDGNAPGGRRSEHGRQSGSASSRSPRPGPVAKREDGGAKRAAVLAYVAANGRVKVRDIAAELGMSAAMASKHLRALRDDNQVQAEGSTQTRVYFTTANGDQATAAKSGRRDLNITVAVKQRITNAIARDPGALTEDRLAQALGLDREQVADACGQLLDEDEISLGADATYTISRGGSASPWT